MTDHVAAQLEESLDQLRKVIGNQAANVVLRTMLGETDFTLISLQMAIEQHDAKEVTFLGHKLKGLFASISSTQLEMQAKQLQLAGLNCDFTIAGELFRRISTSFAQLKIHAENYLSSQQKPSAPDAPLSNVMYNE